MTDSDDRMTEAIAEGDVCLDVRGYIARSLIGLSDKQVAHVAELTVVEVAKRADRRPSSVAAALSVALREGGR